MVTTKTDLFYNWLDVLRALGACNGGIESFIRMDGYDVMRSREAWAGALDSQVLFVLSIADLFPRHIREIAPVLGTCPGCTFEGLPSAEQRARFTYEQVRDALVKRYAETAADRARSLFDE